MKRGFLNNRRPKLPTAAVVHTSPPKTIDQTLTSSSEQKIVISRSVFGKLPSELICEILTRLPAKSLCRFKCVSKLWKSTISDHRFVATHHRLSATRRGGVSVLLTVGVGMTSGHAIYALKPELNPDVVHQLTPPMDNIKFISESVHGLIMLDVGGTVTICNPSTRSFVTLPPATDPDKHSVLDVFNATSFGYDSVTCQHKLLSTSTVMDCQGHFTMLHKIFVLGSSLTRSWRIIGRSHHVPKRAASVFVGGFIYYRAYLTSATTDYMVGERECGHPDEVLIEFDVHLETFRSIKIPKDAIDLQPRFSLVIHWEGRLVIIDYTNLVEEKNSVRLWILEDRKKVKWVHKTIVFASSDGTKYLEKEDVVCVGALSTGDILFARCILTKPFHLLYANLKTESVTIVEVRNLDGLFSSVTLTDHVENVLSLKC